MIKSRVSATGHERIFVKKKATFIICIFSLLLIGVIFYGIHLNQVKEEAKKEAEEKLKLEKLYYAQNTAFWLTCDFSKIYSYCSFENANKKNTAISIYAYNAQSDHELTLDEFYTYISKEYDSNGKPMIYSQPENIKEYIDWYLYQGYLGGEAVRKYETSFIVYLAKKGEKSILDMNYEEIVANLEEFQNDPENKAFMQG